MIIDCISDLHGHYPELEGGDLLIVAGDLTARDLENEHALFDYWINEQPYTKKVVIAGNHDNMLVEKRIEFQFCDYLCDSGTEFEYEEPLPRHVEGQNCIDTYFYTPKKLKIWGSPWTLTFPGINRRCTAFTGTEEELEAKFSLIPADTDILITHGPPYGILDKTVRGKHVGSKSLQMQLFTRLNPKLLVCGHIHESYGTEPKGGFVEYAANCSHVNENYDPVNKPIRIEL